MEPRASVRGAALARSATLDHCPPGVEEDIREYMSNAVASVVEDAGDEPDRAELLEEVTAAVAPLLEDVGISPSQVASFCEQLVAAVFAKEDRDDGEVESGQSRMCDPCASQRGAFESAVDKQHGDESTTCAVGIGAGAQQAHSVAADLQLEELRALESIYQTEGDINVRVVRPPPSDYGDPSAEIEATVYIDLPGPVEIRAPSDFAQVSTETTSASSLPTTEPESATRIAERILEDRLGPPLKSLKRTEAGIVIAPCPSPVHSSSGTHWSCPERVESLPPLHITVRLPSDYPTRVTASGAMEPGGMPVFRISSCWLSNQQLASLCQRLDALWEENAGDQIVFVWLQWLKADSWAHLNLGDEITLQRQNVSQGRLDGRAASDLGEPFGGLLHLIEWWKLRQRELFRQCFEQHCPMCATLKPGTAFTFFWRCEHSACSKCVSEMVRTNTDAETLDAIRCQAKDCGKELAAFVIEEACQGDEVLARKWRALRLQRILENELEEVVFCSRCRSEGVRTPVLPVGGEADNGVSALCPFKCDVCEFVFCGICCGAYHAPESCWADKSRVQGMEQRIPPLPTALRKRALLESLSSVGVDQAHFWDLFKECLALNLQGTPSFKEYLLRWAQSQSLPVGWDVSAIVKDAARTHSLFTKMSIGCEPEVLGAFQRLFDLTYKNVITKDRRNGPVPRRMQVVRVEHVQNVQAWLDYQLKRDMVGRAVAKHSKKLPSWPPKVHLPITAAWRERAREGPERDFVLSLPPLKCDIHEHYLFHGTSEMSAEQIAQHAFQLSCAGSNAGTLYGRGIYLAESVVKSDEYSRQGEDGCRNILVCRALVGIPLYTAEHRPDVSALEINCGYGSTLLGNYHSVIGDREKFRGTFREFIFFNSGLVYPEFLVSYRPLFEAEAIESQAHC